MTWLLFSLVWIWMSKTCKYWYCLLCQFFFLFHVIFTASYLITLSLLKITEKILYDITGKNRIWISRNPLLHERRENSSKNCQNQLFQNSEINQKLQQFRKWVFKKKKWLNFIKNGEFCGVSTVFAVALKTSRASYQVICRKSSLEAIFRSQMGFEFLRKPQSQKLIVI